VKQKKLNNGRNHKVPKILEFLIDKSEFKIGINQRLNLKYVFYLVLEVWAVGLLWVLLDLVLKS